MSSDQMPAPGKTKLIKFPLSRAEKDVKCPGYAPGGGDVEASIWLIHYLRQHFTQTESHEANITVESPSKWTSPVVETSESIEPNDTDLELNAIGYIVGELGQEKSCSVQPTPQ